MPDRAGAAAGLDATDRRIINALQGDFPLVAEPYRAVADALGLSEAELQQRIDAMLERKVLTRFGPMFQVERMGGAFVLAAMCVPEANWQHVVNIVNAFPAVAHNYRRESDRACPFNMWFVLATETADGIASAVRTIEAASGLPVFAFLKLREYFVEMKLPVRA